MTAIDDTFHRQRAQLREGTVAQATAIWQTDRDDRNRYLGKVLTLVEAGQKAIVLMTSGYMTAKTREQLGEARAKSLDPADYTVSKLRGEPAVSVYARPFGALYGQLNEGVPKDQAEAGALDALSTLVATDLQMAYTASARDWMAGDSRIGGFRRILSGTCDYCEAAADGLYAGHEQMPIHENCECGVEPQFGSRAAVAAATGMAFHATTKAGTTTAAEAGDLETRLDTTGEVPPAPKPRSATTSGQSSDNSHRR